MKFQQSLDEIRGHLDVLDEPKFDRLDFQWENIHFRAHSRLNEQNGNGVKDKGKIYIKAQLGRLYYNIEDRDQRAQAINQVYLNNRGIDGAYSIDAKGIVHYESMTTTEQHLLGPDLMSALTLILLEAESHMRPLKNILKPTD